MNVIATKQKVTALDFDNLNAFSSRGSRPRLRVVESPPRAEDALTQMILQGENGRSLLTFCRELSMMLIRTSLGEDDAGGVRANLCCSLVETLACSDHEANCLVDLAMELIHTKVHQVAVRSDGDLSYLITMASDAVAG